jgi:putative hydrolase of HD superfamily
LTDLQAVVQLLLESATLKRMPRVGWAMRGVPYVESVAEHSFGVVLVALALVDILRDGAEPEEPGLDAEKVLIMALLHDLAEVRLTDLPASAVRLIPEEVKSRAEAQALAGMLAPLPGAERLRVLWQEFEDRSSPEGRLVRDADKLEMMIQCLRYEQAGSRGLDEFWQAIDRLSWHYAVSGEVYAWLKTLRPGSQLTVRAV